MARKRNPLRNEAYKIWIESNKKKALKDIAKELNVSDSTVRKWKSEDKWDGETKRNAPFQSERYVSMKGNKNAKGNSGGKAPPNNQNAVTHGLFSKWLPSETAEIIEEMQSKSESDMIWDSIVIQYTAIIRAQKIMFVDSSNDLSKEVSVEGQFGNTYDIQFAWDKQANFMNAQSRAMSTLSNLIKQFVAIADDQDERRLKLELMNAQISKVKIDQELSKIKVDALGKIDDQTTEDKLDELLGKISEAVDDN